MEQIVNGAIARELASSKYLPRPRVLVVDDVYANRYSLLKLLESVDADIIEASSGREALSLLIDTDFALILLDVRMPDLDGLDVLSIIHSEPTTRSIPVILFTADQSDEKNVARAYRTGAVDYLYKPMDPHILLGKVQVFIDLHNSKAQLQLTTTQLETILNTAAQGICGLGERGLVQFANPAALRMAGKDLVGSAFMDRLFTEDYDSLPATIHSHVDAAVNGNGGVRDERFSIKTSDGEFVPVQLSVTPVKKNQSTLVSAVVVFSDITDSKRLENKLAKLARYDSLTGLANRTLFYECLSKALARAKRQNTRLALFFIDLDHFKKINDTMGHLAGDQLLIEFATRIQTHCREVDQVARLGGDEFTVIMESFDDIHSVERAAEKILYLTQTPFFIENNEIYSSVSIGVAIFPDAATDVETLTRSADIAMYQAKENGRNSYQIFTKQLNSRIAARVSVEQELRKALRRDEFELHYQPRVLLNNGHINGFEALLRWRHPQKGFVEPKDFIGIAEETGMILELGEWVLHSALRQKRLWQQQGLFDGKRLAVNLSPHQIERGKVIENLLRIVGDTGDDSLELEITETAVMQDVRHVGKILSAITERGIHVAIDDFGIGYSSLSKLKSLPISILKIDRSFVCDIAHDNNDAAIVRAIITMAHTLDLTVVAEGVESEAHRDLLLSYQCPLAQGFHFSRPVSADAAQCLLLEQQEMAFS